MGSARWRSCAATAASSSPGTATRFKQWPQLAEEIAHAVRAHNACSMARSAAWNRTAAPHFNKLLFRREWPHFYAFDVLSIEGEDLTALPLLERKRRLLAIMPAVECRLLYLDHLEARGRDLFRVACERDLEGIVGKWAGGTYRTDGRATSWLKIKNRDYTQMVDRHELFADRHRQEGRARARASRVDLVLR